MQKVSFTNSDVYKYIFSLTFADFILQGISCLTDPPAPEFNILCNSYDNDFCVNNEEIFQCSSSDEINGNEILKFNIFRIQRNTEVFVSES